VIPTPERVMRLFTEAEAFRSKAMAIDEQIKRGELSLTRAELYKLHLTGWAWALSLIFLVVPLFAFYMLLGMYRK